VSVLAKSRVYRVSRNEGSKWVGRGCERWCRESRHGGLRLALDWTLRGLESHDGVHEQGAEQRGLQQARHGELGSGSYTRVPVSST
jgi:hypothetical protein